MYIGPDDSADGIGNDGPGIIDAEVVDGIQVKPGWLADLIIERCNSGQSAGKMLSPVGAPTIFEPVPNASDTLAKRLEATQKPAATEKNSEGTAASTAATAPTGEAEIEMPVDQPV